MSETKHMLITKRSMRPYNTKKQECFYCKQPIGSEHKYDCVLIQKTVKVRMIVEYEVSVPNFWDGDLIESHRNNGSWCSDNALDELSERSKIKGCMCDITRFEYLGEDSKPFIKEE